MTKFIKNISQFVNSQFPEWMRENGNELTTSDRVVLIDFVEAYYEWLEESYENSNMLNREMMTLDDIDTTLDDYVKYFREKYLKDFPYVAATDERFLIKNIIDFYRTKGTPRSIQLLIRILFNKNSEVYLPGQDIFRLSHSRWYEPKYLEVLHEDGTFDLLNRQVIGANTKAKAFVEGVVTKRINGVFIDLIYLSDIKGTFETGERVVPVDSGNISTSPLIIGSLSSVTTDDTSLNGVSVGDIFDVVSERGRQGKAKVTETYSFGRKIEIDIEDGGYGYTLDSMTDLYISDTIMYANNIPSEFSQLDLLTQKLESLTISNNAYGDAESYANGESFTAYNSSNTATATGVLIDMTPWSISDSDTTLILQIDTGTLLPSLDITTNSDTIFIEGETVTEGSDVSFNLATSNGTFNVGDRVYQISSVNDTITHYAVGEVTSANSGYMNITHSFGDWTSTYPILNYNDTDATAAISDDIDITVTYTGGSGIVNEVYSNTSIRIATSNIDKFNSNNEIRGSASSANSIIATTVDVSATSINIDGNDYSIAETANLYYTAYLVESSNTILKLDTVTNEFKFMNGVSELHGTSNSVIITENTSGRGLNFELDALDNTETVNMSTLKFTDRNIADVQLMDLTIDALNSSVYRVTEITPNVAGTGYSNGEVVTVIGGGVSNNTPYIPARGYVTTNGSGGIISVNLIQMGERYISDSLLAIVDTSGGSSATFNITTETGYGFEGSLYGNANSTIEDAFNFQERTLGTIKRIGNINLGTGYTVTPCIYIENPFVHSSNIYDKVLNVQLTSKSFKIGEIITQPVTNARGIVQSYNTLTKNIQVRVISFESRFISGNPILGAETGATANVLDVTNLISEPVMGSNANIALSVVLADGIVKTLKVIDSGYGYINGETINLENETGTLTGTTYVETHGISSGYWRTFDSHPSGTKKLHDNFYYQEYSYDIKTPVPLDKYRKQIKDILHVAGTEYFGSVTKETEKKLAHTSEMTISVT